jgi:hypothetical protein
MSISVSVVLQLCGCMSVGNGVCSITKERQGCVCACSCYLFGKYLFEPGAELVPYFDSSLYLTKCFNPKPRAPHTPLCPPV